MSHWWLLIPILPALALSLWSFRGHRTTSPRCPRCWYDMTGGTLTCPECGHTAANPQALHRPRRRWRLAALGLITALGCLFAAVPKLPRAAYYALAPTWHATQTVIVPGYEVRILEHTDPDEIGRAAEIKDSRGHVLCHIDGMYFTLGSQSNPAARAIGIAEDMTGDGISDLVITWDSGGSGCQQIHYLFQIGSPREGGGFAPLAVIDACGYFQDKDGDGIPEFVASDRTYSYRWTSGAGSPHPEVILRWHKQQHRYIVATDLTCAPPLTEQALASLIGRLQQIESKPGDETRRSSVLTEALRLIYSGNLDQGLRVLRETWPDRAGLDDFMLDFTHASFESPYTSEIEALQSVPPPETAPKQP